MFIGYFKILFITKKGVLNGWLKRLMGHDDVIYRFKFWNKRIITMKG